MYIDCKKKAQEIKNGLKQKISMNEDKPILTIVQVGNNPASNSYVKGKIKDCKEVGIICNHIKYENEKITEDELTADLLQLQKECDGIIVQLPLPKHLKIESILPYVYKEKDVDGFLADSPFTPCTPNGIMTILEEVTDLCGKDVLIINRSNIVGRPLVNLLLDKDATVTIAHSKTKNIRSKINKADIIITAVGIPNFITYNDLFYYDKPLIQHKRQIIIDVSINRDENGKLCGDVEKGCEDIADITPVPNGIGLMTRASLLQNVYKSYEDKKRKA